MDEYFLEEDDNGTITLYDGEQRPIKRFTGSDALEQALAWSHAKGLRLHSNVNLMDLLDGQRFAFRRRPRFMRFYRFRSDDQHNQDAPNVKRIIVPIYDDNDFDDDFDEFFDDDEIILAPEDDDEDLL